MARKNMFEGLTPSRPDEAPSPTPARAAPRMPEVFQSAGPVAAIRNDLRTMGSRSVQEIDPDLIEDSGMKDRLGLDDDTLIELRDSIAKHGQQVPILLRPHPALSGRYQVVYGRRRLAAIRGLGTPVKALIRSLTDEEAVLAQGQENNLRKDPSFVEKALFAGDLEEAGYDARVVQEALNVNRSHTSHMRKVREAFPRDVIERIGAAPSVGWKRWYDLATQVLDKGAEPRLIHPAPFGADLTSDQRFEAWARAFQAATAPRATPQPPSKQPVLARDGTELGLLTLRKGGFSFQAAKPGDAFAQWLTMQGPALMRALHDDFLAQGRAKDDTQTPPQQ